MTRKRAILNRLLIVAPWATVTVLVVMAMLLPNRTRFSPQAAARKAEVAAAVEAVPMLIGRWVGDQWEVPREAQELLKPNAILSRTYTSLGGSAVHVLMVHCSDSRDMVGHYPPICYPSAGWEMEPVSEQEELTLRAGSMELPVRQYRFRGIRERGREDNIRIFSTFILPDGSVTPDKDDMYSQSERLSVAVQGVAQFQVITSGLVPLEQAISDAEEILSGMQGLFDALQAADGDST